MTLKIIIVDEKISKLASVLEQFAGSWEPVLGVVVPSGQGVHSVCWAYCWNVPISQGTHTLLLSSYLVPGKQLSANKNNMNYAPIVCFGIS